MLAQWTDFSHRQGTQPYRLHRNSDGPAESEIFRIAGITIAHPILVARALCMELGQTNQDDKGIGRLWCRLMHDAPTWPVRDHYRCGICGRIHTFHWDGGAEGRPEKSRVAATFARLASRLFVLRDH